MEFRKSTPQDAHGIWEIEQESFSDAWSQRSIEDLLCSETCMCYSAVDNGEVVAYFLGRLIAPEGELYRIAVRADKRKRGIGYRLLDYSYKSSKGRGLESLYLEVRSQNVPARNLYHAYGFRIIGERKNYYRDPTDDAVLMMINDRLYFE